MSQDQSTTPAIDQLLRANLERVFNQRDAAERLRAIEQLFVANPVMYEPDAVIEGRQAIADVAGKLLEQFGPDFAFTPEREAVGHHGMGSLRWQAGPKRARPVVSGIDTAEFVDGRISRLWVLIDSARK